MGDEHGRPLSRPRPSPQPCSVPARWTFALALGEWGDGWHWTCTSGLGSSAARARPRSRRPIASLAKQLHPDRNKDNPKAAERFAEVTQRLRPAVRQGQARALRPRRDRRGRQSQDAVRRRLRRRPARCRRRPGGLRGLPGGGFQGGFGGGDAADLSDLFEGLFGAARAPRRRRRLRRLSASARRTAAKGRRHRLPAERAVRRRRDAEAAADHARPTARRSTSSCPRASRTAPRSASPARASRARAAPATRSSPSPSRRTPSSRRDGDDIRLDLPVTLNEAVLGAKVKVPTPDGPVMLTVPKGSSSGKVLRLKGRGFTGKNGHARRPAGHAARSTCPPATPSWTRFAERWSGGGNPRAALGRLALRRMQDHSP